MLRFDKNYRLIQFQYKLLMQISICRYMWHKMKTDTVSRVWIHFGTELETVNHLFLKCRKVTPLIAYSDKSINETIEEKHTDIRKVFYLTCCYENIGINFLWSATKHYIGLKFWYRKPLSLIGLKNYIKSKVLGESTAQQQLIGNALVNN